MTYFYFQKSSSIECSMILQNILESNGMIDNLIERFRMCRRVQKCRSFQNIQKFLEYSYRIIQNNLEYHRIIQNYIEENRIIQNVAEEFRNSWKSLEVYRRVQKCRTFQKFCPICRTFEMLFLALPWAENAESKIFKNFFLHRNFDLIYQIQRYEFNWF